MTVEERRRVLSAAAPGNPTSTGWDHVIERDYARLDLANTETVKFAYLYAGRLLVGGGGVRWEGGSGLTLALYVADTLTQARALYPVTARVRGLLGLREEGWHLRPNFHFGYWERGMTWTTSTLDIESYIEYWKGRIHELHAYRRDEWDAELARLVADGIVSREDESQFGADFRQTRRQVAYPRPAVALSRSWGHARSRDRRFPRELRAALRQVLAALGEPLETLERQLGQA